MLPYLPAKAGRLEEVTDLFHLGFYCTVESGEKFRQVITERAAQVFMNSYLPVTLTGHLCARFEPDTHLFCQRGILRVEDLVLSVSLIAQICPPTLSPFSATWLVHTH